MTVQEPTRECVYGQPQTEGPISVVMQQSC